MRPKARPRQRRWCPRLWWARSPGSRDARRYHRRRDQISDRHRWYDEIGRSRPGGLSRLWQHSAWHRHTVGRIGEWSAAAGGNWWTWAGPALGRPCAADGWGHGPSGQQGGSATAVAAGRRRSRSGRPGGLGGGRMRTRCGPDRTRTGRRRPGGRGQRHGRSVGRVPDLERWRGVTGTRQPPHRGEGAGWRWTASPCC